MKDISEFATVNEKGEIVIDYDAYNKELASELDRARTQASQTAKQNAEKELRASLVKELKEKAEAEAKMTADELLKAEKEAFQKERLEFDKKQVEAIYKEAGISDNEIELLTALLGEDTTKNLETAKKFAEARKTYNEESKIKLTEELQLKTPDPKKKEGGEDIGSLMAKEVSSQNAGSGYVKLSVDAPNDVKI